MIRAEILQNNVIIIGDNVVADSVKFETVSFKFPESWDGFEKTVIFMNGTDGAFRVVLNEENPLCISENECYIPHEVLCAPGFELSVFGVCGNSVATATKTYVRVLASGYAEGGEPEDPTPTEYQQLINLASEAKDIAQSVRDDVDNGVLKGQKGEKGDTGPQGEKGEKGDKGEDAVIDLSYNPTSKNAQSGIAVAEAIADIELSEGGGTVDQAYSPTSKNAQSGIAVAEAIAGIELPEGGGTVDQAYSPTSENAQSGIAVAEAVSGKMNVFGTVGNFADSNGNGWYDAVRLTATPTDRFWMVNPYGTFQIEANDGIMELGNSKINLCDVAGSPIPIEGVKTPTDSSSDYQAANKKYVDDAISSVGGSGGAIEVDQAYDPTSENAQSGTAVAEALKSKFQFWESNKHYTAGDSVLAFLQYENNLNVYTVGMICLKEHISPNTEYPNLTEDFEENWVYVPLICHTAYSATCDSEYNHIVDTYATKKHVYSKQDKLISGENLKTINGESLLGSGDIVISGGSGGDINIDQAYSATSTNAQSGVAVAEAIENKMSYFGNWNVQINSVTNQKYGRVLVGSVLGGGHLSDVPVFEIFNAAGSVGLVSKNGNQLQVTSDGISVENGLSNPTAINGVATPDENSSEYQAANKKYVDDAISRLEELINNVNASE